MIEQSRATELVQVQDQDEGAPDAAETQEIRAVQEPTDGPAPKRRRNFIRRTVARASFGVWFGLVLAAAGFGVIAFTWSKVAALTDVAQQMPYIVSGGLAGLGLILVGLMVVNLTVKRREAADRSRQLEEVRDALIGLRASIEGADVEDEA